MVKSAIVTTLVKSNHVLDSFIKYHQAVGFNHLFLFFDDPSEMNDFDFTRYENITVIPVDESLKTKWKKTRLFSLAKGYTDYIGSEVMARQILNVQIAMEICIDRGIEWLLHIDIDELFYCPATSASEHFSSLTQKGIVNVTYLNFEAASTNFETTDYFKEVKHFKRHPALLRKDLQEYIKRQKRFTESQLYYLYYMNGKSAAKVTSDLLPKDVHTFYTGSPPFFCTTAFVLHYPVCGFSHFVNKYQALGRFSDNWFGTLPVNLPFHLMARDAYLKNDSALLKDFFIKFILFSDPHEINDLLEKGILILIDEPAKILSVA